MASEALEDWTPDSLREIAVEAARLGGQTLLAWRERFTAKEKGPADLVTDADFASQEAVRKLLADRRPDDHFVGEEKIGVDQTRPGPGEIGWIVDPLDGTVNYVHGFPAFATSVGAVIDGQPVAGAIYDPLREEIFSASRGGGAWVNDTPLQVSGAASLGKSLVAVSLPPQVTGDSPDIAAFVDVLERARAVRRTGSAALNLAYVAAGRLDAHWAHVIYPWDAAAGVLIAAEAGATVSNCAGGPFDVWRADYLVASTAELHRELLEMMSSRST
ncbi:inositol monophosphatase family protein [Botrimarina sp.]|uniref:inositol monophosphatase family protein n=1 Tax=Botrimarina sp. TaxID=2795802 RepID=UPI0032EB5101